MLFGAEMNAIAILKTTRYIVPRLFEEKRRDIVFGFPWCMGRNA